jgi:hypothetical protein
MIEELRLPRGRTSSSREQRQLASQLERYFRSNLIHPIDHVLVTVMLTHATMPTHPLRGLPTVRSWRPVASFAGWNRLCGETILEPAFKALMKRNAQGRVKICKCGAIGSRTCGAVGGDDAINPVVVRVSDVAFNESKDCLKVTLLGARFRSSARPRQPVHRSLPPYQPKYSQESPWVTFGVLASVT